MRKGINISLSTTLSVRISACQLQLFYRSAMRGDKFSDHDANLIVFPLFIFFKKKKKTSK